jgi:hypothetical protein
MRLLGLTLARLPVGPRSIHTLMRRCQALLHVGEALIALAI